MMDAKHIAEAAFGAVALIAIVAAAAIWRVRRRRGAGAQSIASPGLTINFKDRNQIAPSFLILLSTLLLVGTLAYVLFVPEPSAAGVVKGRNLSRNKILKEIADASLRADQALKADRPRLWTGDAEAVTAQVLAQVTEEARTRSLKVTAFRPQRPQAFDTVTELTYSVQVTGPYPRVRAVAAALDKTDEKIVLRSVQIASADEATSAVTATFGLSAYVSTEPLPPSKPVVAPVKKPVKKGKPGKSA